MKNNKPLERAEIIAALRAECAECSEHHWCNHGTNGVGMYCPAQDAAQLLERDAEPPNDPLTLDELRGMDREPVWVEYNNGARQWHIVKEFVEYAGQHIICWKDGGIEPLQDYGVTWLTYRRKPEGGGE